MAARPPHARASSTSGVLPLVLCVRCGAVLGPDDLTAEHIAILAQLNRFGLTGRDGLLKVAPADVKAAPSETKGP